MLTKPISSNLVAAVLVLVVMLGAYGWYLEPELAPKWAITMFIMPVCWGGIEFLKRTGARRRPNADLNDLRSAIAGAGLILAVALILDLAATLDFIDGSSGEISRRVMQAIIGIVLAIYGNSIPKRLAPSSETACEPSRMQSLQRFAGWTFVLAGLAYSIVWLTFPVERANSVSMLMVAASVVLVGVRCAWSVTTRKRGQPLAEF